MVSLMYLLNPSTIMMKTKGDIEYPYVIPHKGEKVLEGEPLTKMEKKTQKR